MKQRILTWEIYRMQTFAGIHRKARIRNNPLVVLRPVSLWIVFWSGLRELATKRRTSTDSASPLKALWPWLACTLYGFIARGTRTLGWNRARREFSQLGNQKHLLLCPLSVSQLSQVLWPRISQGCHTGRSEMLICCEGSTDCLSSSGSPRG